MISGLLKRIGLKPFHDKERHLCPFYGFFLSPIGGALLDQEGNQCALITGSTVLAKWRCRNKLQIGMNAHIIVKRISLILEQFLESIGSFQRNFGLMKNLLGQAYLLRDG